MAFQIKRIPGFGGGLNFSGHPSEIADNEWSFSNGFFAKDGYAEQCTALGNLSVPSYLVASHVAADIFPNPFDPEAAYVTSGLSTTGALYDMDLVAPTGTQVTASGGFAPTVNGGNFVTSTAMLENELYVNFGAKAVASGNYGIVRLTPTAGGAGPASFTRIDQVAGAEVGASLQAAHLEICRDYLIAAGVDAAGTGSQRDMYRRIARCDTLRGNKWNERLWNSAKVEDITELDWPITGLARTDADTVLLFSMDRVIALRYTGSNPPFTRANAVTDQGHVGGQVGVGTTHQVRGGVGKTPLGVVFQADDNFYVWSGGPQPIGDKIRRYLRERLNPTARILKPVWHAHWGLLIVPVAVGSTWELFYYDPSTKAWARRVSETGSTTVSHCFIPSFGATNSEYKGRYVVLQSGGAIFSESTASPPTGFASAFVDTKDFHFEDPSSNDYVDRIGIDWEPLTNSGTDQITVQASVRDEMSLATLGSLGAETQPSFTTQGTLTGGTGELPLRLRGKFVRFRFLVSSGRVRIRGFTLRWQRGSERAA